MHLRRKSSFTLTWKRKLTAMSIKKRLFRRLASRFVGLSKHVVNPKLIENCIYICFTQHTVMAMLMVHHFWLIYRIECVVRWWLKCVDLICRCREPVGSTTRRTPGPARGRTRRSGDASTTEPGRGHTGREAGAGIVTGMLPLYYYCGGCNHRLILLCCQGTTLLCLLVGPELQRWTIVFSLWNV